MVQATLIPAAGPQSQHLHNLAQGVVVGQVAMSFDRQAEATSVSPAAWGSLKDPISFLFFSWVCPDLHSVGSTKGHLHFLFAPLGPATLIKINTHGQGTRIISEVCVDFVLVIAKSETYVAVLGSQSRSMG